MLQLLLVGLLAQAPLHSSAARVRPAVRLEHAGFVRDARASVDLGNRFHYEARVAAPAVVSRRAFVVEALDANGTVVFAREARAQGRKEAGRVARAVRVHFDLDLPALDGVATLRVRLADEAR